MDDGSFSLRSAQYFNEILLPSFHPKCSKVSSVHKDGFTYVYLTNLLSNYSWRRAGMFKSK